MARFVLVALEDGQFAAVKGLTGRWIMDSFPPLRPEIALSWQRSAANGLSPSAPVDTLTLAEIDRRSRLLVAANPVLDELAHQLSGTGFCVMLADRESRLVDRRFDSGAVERGLANAAAVDLVTAADHPVLRELALDLLAVRGHKRCG